MKHHEDPIKLQAIKTWLEDDDRLPASKLADDIGYPDFKKYGKLLIEVWNTPQEERPEKIARCSITAGERGISRSCFRSVVNHVLGKTDTFFASLATDDAPALTFISQVWLDLEKLAYAQEDKANSLKTISENLAALSLENNRRELNTILAAGALAYYTRRADAEGEKIDGQSNKVSICQPVLNVLHCPASGSSVTRYAEEFQKLATALVEGEPESIFIPDFEVWWKAVLMEIRKRCDYGPKAFFDIIDILKDFPGSQNIFYLKTEKKKPDDKKPVQPTLEEKITQEVGDFNKMPPNKQKKLLNKKLESVYAASLFLNGVTLVDATNHDIPTGTLKKIQGLNSELKKLLQPNENENSTLPESTQNESSQLSLENV